MKILALGNCPLDPKLGSGQTRLHWAEGLRNLGHDVVVWEPSDYAKPGFKKIRIAFSGARALWKFWAEPPEAILFYGDEFWLAAGLARLRRGKAPRPLLVAHSDGVEPCFRGFLKKLLPEGTLSVRRKIVEALYGAVSPLSFQWVDGVICGSALERDFAERHGYGKKKGVRMIEPGLRESFLLSAAGWEAREKAVIFLGHWTDAKSPDQLVEVMGDFLAEYPEWKFEVVGSGKSEEELAPLFPREVWPRVRMYDKLTEEEVRTRMESAALYLSASRFEGFGLATAEAMACGCAVVATRTGFAAGLEPGQAWIVEPGDAPGLAAGLRRLAASPEERQRMGREGRVRAQQLDWKRSVQLLESCLAEWMDTNR
jgi:glycosyltransferase involved in cell wall biosynthesis